MWWLFHWLPLLALVFDAAAYPQDHLYAPSPFLPQQSLRSKKPTRTVVSHFRDSIIRKVWSVPEPRSPAGSRALRSKSDPPSTLQARYGGDVVLRFQISSFEEARALANAVNVLFLDVWEFTSQWADIRLSKDDVPSLLGLLPRSLNDAHTPLIHDLARTIFESYPSTTSQETSNTHGDRRTFSPTLDSSDDTDRTNIFFRNYQPLSVILPWMRLLSSLFPTHVRVINIGMSYEGRDITALKVGVHPTNSEKPSSPRKTVIIAGGSHAREWISTSTVNYVAYNFITAYGKFKEVTKLLEEFDWIFIPTLNPDGYVYTWDTDRLWRKNRQETSLRFCKGVDLDRSYGYEWDHQASSDNPCSESFSGEAPFEAVESQRFASWARNETENNNVRIVAFLDLHSYSQQVLYPYSYSCTSAPPTLENLEELALGLAKAIRIANGETYGVTSACEGSVSTTTSSKTKKNTDPKLWPRIESGGGSALDWFYHELRVKYAYQIKLRDTGSYGFLLPAENIVPTGKEAFNALKYMGEYLRSNKGIESNAAAEESQEKEEQKDGQTSAGRSGKKQDIYSGAGSQKKKQLLFPDREDFVVAEEEEGGGGGEESDELDDETQFELRRRRRRK